MVSDDNIISVDLLKIINEKIENYPESDCFF